MTRFYDGVDIHTYVNNKNSKYYELYKVYIQLPEAANKEVIEGLSVSDQPFQMTVSSTYDDSAAGKVADVAAGAPGAIFGGNGTLTGQATNQEVGRQTISGTISKFASTNKIQVRCEILFFKEFLPSGQSYRDILDRSIRMVVPDRSKIGTGGNVELLAPPLEYNPGPIETLAAAKAAVNPNNTITVGFGKGIIVTHLICTQFTYTESTQKYSDGSPVYIKGSYDFTTARVLMADEVLKWFDYAK